jgi:hypothetical protein
MHSALSLERAENSVRGRPRGQAGLPHDRSAIMGPRTGFVRDDMQNLIRDSPALTK